MRAAAVKRFRAWLLLATFVVTLGLTGLSPDHLGLIDIACGAVELTPAARPMGVGPASVGHLQHCPVCHFARAVSGASSTSVVRLAVQDGLALETVEAVRVPPGIDQVAAPSRGPPSLTPSVVI